MGGFDRPILHGKSPGILGGADLADDVRVCAGLCSFGFSGKHIVKAFGPYKDIKTR